MSFSQTDGRINFLAVELLSLSIKLCRQPTISYEIYTKLDELHKYQNDMMQVGKLRTFYISQVIICSNEIFLELFLICNFI